MKVAYLSYHEVSTYNEISVVARRYSMIMTNEQWNMHCIHHRCIHSPWGTQVSAIICILSKSCFSGVSY